MNRIKKAKAVVRERVARFRSSRRDAANERKLLEQAENIQNNRGVNADQDFETISAEFVENFEVDPVEAAVGPVEISVKCDVGCEILSPELSSAVTPMEVDSPDIYSKFKADLKKWIIESTIARIWVDPLLKLLQPVVPWLPSSHKTFLKSNIVFNIQKNSDGSLFVNFGLEEGLKRCINIHLHGDGEVLPLQLFLDGMSPYNSSNIQLWPLMGRIYHDPDIYPPFPIACHCGPGKPKDIDAYFGQFIGEYNQLHKTGFMVGNRFLKIKIMCLVGDKPARSEALRIKGHTSKHACERCDIVAIRYKNRQVFPLLKNCKPRTDKSFRLLEDPQHHHIELSPLTKIQPPMDLVYQVILEFMHGDCIGNMSRLLDLWTDPSLKYLTKAQIMQLSQRLSLLQFCIPAEFQRCTRSLDVLSKWKATEYRLFLLYVGAIVLKGILPEHLYKHFLLFSVGCRILCTPGVCLKYTGHARTYLVAFVELSKKYYGLESQTFNMHCTAHLPDDVENMQCDLSHYTAFPFENYLQFLNKKIKSGFSPLAQLCNRVAEEWSIEPKPAEPPKLIEILKPSKISENSDTAVDKVKFKYVTLTKKSPNNTVMLKSGKILMIKEMKLPGSEKDPAKIQVTGEILETVGDVYHYPTLSSQMNIHKVQRTKNKITCELHDVELKFMNANLKDIEKDADNFHVIPILHMICVTTTDCTSVPLRVLELDSELEPDEKFIIAPVPWIEIDDKEKVLVAKYLFPPRDPDDEDLFKGIFDSRVVAPAIWPSFRILKSHHETVCLKTAQRKLKDVILKAAELKQKELTLKSISKTSLDLEDISSLTDHPTLFSKESMIGTEISGNFLQAIENNNQQSHNVSPSKTKPSGTENEPKKRKLRARQILNSVTEKKSSASKKPKKSQAVDKPKPILRRRNQQVISKNTSESISKVDSTDNTPSIERSAASDSPTDHQEIEDATDMIQQHEDPPSEAVISSEHSIHEEVIHDPSSHYPPAGDGSTGPSRVYAEVTPIQMPDLATKQDFQDFKEWSSQRYNSIAQQIAGNNSAIKELKNAVLGKALQGDNQEIILSDTFKTKHGLSIPFQTQDEFEMLEENIEKILVLRQDLQKYFNSVISSASDGKESIRGILKTFFKKSALFGNYVALQGTHKKKAFIDTQFGRILYDCFRTKVDLSTTILRKSFSDCILGIKDWEGGRAERTRKSNNDEELAEKSEL
ncbi:hypothetical protein QAD02_004509 [Eretmocerus hayati]|uniref:Uncharacterized protein n=1 Tax=Eretmocerus hayati TaxID=131215 RepID=A0ACC2NQ62_9HYME|nr:hypothetical protein QAD02_004509 [Eretmocerus hayati]